MRQNSDWVEMDGDMDVLNTSTFRITHEVLGLISRIDEFKGAWRALGRIAPDRLARLRRVATIESIGSSTRIEGARLSDSEVEQLLSGLETRSFADRDEQEIAGYAEVMNTLFTDWQAISLTENHVRQLHRDLLKYSDKDERHRGSYKTLPNHVEAFGPDGKSLGVIFATASPFETPRLMSELVTWFGQAERTAAMHPLVAIAVFTVVFLEIHPFQDGNGRLSRILTTLLLLRAGYDYVPYSSLESVIEDRKEAYYLALRRTQATIRTPEPDWEPWIRFFLDALQEQTRRLEMKMDREQVLAATLPALSLEILDLARAHGRLTVADVVRATGANRNTVKDHLKSLVADRHLVLHGAGRGAWYGLV